MINISLFPKITTISGGEIITIQDFFLQIQHGKWKEQTDKVRAETDKKARNTIKAKVMPYVTISGTFEPRTIAGLQTHSGLLCMDFDNIENVPEARKKLESDPYTLACLLSVSGTGLAAIIKIDPDKHIDSFLALEEYYWKQYQLESDPACKDVCRPRFCSYDPDIFQNEKAKIFKDYLKKKPPIKRLPTYIVAASDTEKIIQQCEQNRIDLDQGDYERFRNIGFALAAEYGESGRDYYHRLSSMNEKYTPAHCDKQFDRCLRSKSTGVTLATLFHYAKEAGCKIISERTKHIVSVAKMQKRGGIKAASVVNALEILDGIEPQDSESIIKQVYENDIDLREDNELSQDEQLQRMLKEDYLIRKNEITRYLEIDGRELETEDINSLWLECRKRISEKLKFELLDRTLHSNLTPKFNPIIDYIEANRHRTIDGNIDTICKAINSDTGWLEGEFDPDFVKYFFTKWAIGMIASIYGKHSPLLLALTGSQRTGKTEFFRRLLPNQLKRFYAESRLDAGKDDEILMTQKLIIMDDEMSGKSKLENKKLKELTSKQHFTLREPYGRRNVTLQRLATLSGTANDNALLSDPTGNRRIIPINILSIDIPVYNSVDKDELFMEFVRLYDSGQSWELSGQDIERLNASSSPFEQVCPEAELLNIHFGIPDSLTDPMIEKMTSTEIKDYLERITEQRLSLHKLGLELKAHNFHQKPVKMNGKNYRFWFVLKKNEASGLPKAEF